jgi:hypothetical protein
MPPEIMSLIGTTASDGGPASRCAGGGASISVPQRFYDQFFDVPVLEGPPSTREDGGTSPSQAAW